MLLLYFWLLWAIFTFLVELALLAAVPGCIVICCDRKELGRGVRVGLALVAATLSTVLATVWMLVSQSFSFVPHYDPTDDTLQFMPQPHLSWGAALLVFNLAYITADVLSYTRERAAASATEDPFAEPTSPLY